MSSQDAGHTVLDLLNRSAKYLASKGSPSPRLDAELLLANVLGCSRISLYVGFDKPLGSSEVDAYRQAVMRRGRREPVAYITGTKEFMGRDFRVGGESLVPRPETELLAERGMEAIKDSEGALVAEVCCGGGAAGISVALSNGGSRLLLTDISEGCLEVARLNVELHGLTDRSWLIRSDLFESWPGELFGRFDAVLANPPYIPSDEIRGLEPEVSVHEPRLALDGGPDGLSILRRIASSAKGWLRPGGALILEVGHDQAKEVSGFLEASGFRGIRSQRDLQGYERVVEATA